MAIIYNFPSNEERDECEWVDAYSKITTLLTDLGANLSEIEQLKPCIRERWEALLNPLEIPFEYQLVGPLTDEQREAFRNVLRAQAAEISGHYSKRRAAMFLELVKLEFEIVRLKRVE